MHCDCEFYYLSQNDFATSNAQDETFGEDIYEPISGNQEEQRNVPAEK